MATANELDDAAMDKAVALAHAQDFDGTDARKLATMILALVPALRAARQRIAALEKEIPAWAAYDKTEGWNRDGLLAIGNALNAKDRRIAELEDALRQIAIAPCMYELLGEPETCEHSCPGCRARKALGDAATIAVTKEGTKNG